MLEMCIKTFCKDCGKEKNPHEIGNGKPCKYCGGDIVSASKERLDYHGGILNYIKKA